MTKFLFLLLNFNTIWAFWDGWCERTSSSYSCRDRFFPERVGGYFFKPRSNSQSRRQSFSTPPEFFVCEFSSLLFDFSLPIYVSPFSDINILHNSIITETFEAESSLLYQITPRLSRRCKYH